MEKTRGHSLGDNPDATLFKAKGRELVNAEVSHPGAVVLDNVARLTGRSTEGIPHDHDELTSRGGHRSDELHT